VVVEAAEEPDGVFLDGLKARLLEQTHAKDVRFDVKINQSLIAGYKLSMESIVQDFSIKGRLKEFEAELHS